MTTHIVFLPGIMGTELLEGSNRRSNNIKRWFSPWDRQVKRLRDENGINTEIIAGHPLREALRFKQFRIESNVVYADIMDFLDKFRNLGYSFHPFGFDWREDIREKCVILDNFIREFYQDNDTLIFVAHSMGGLLTHTYCQWAQDENCLPNISTIVTLGTPWHGTPSAFQALKYGIDKTCFPNPNITAYVARACPSSVQLLPSMEYTSKFNHYIRSEDNMPMYWKDIFEYLKRLKDFCIEDPEQVNIALHSSLKKPWPEGIKHYNLVGVGKGTIDRIHLSAHHGDSLMPADGDETVPFQSALPPKNYGSLIYFTESEHGQLAKLKHVYEFLSQVIENSNTGSTGISVEGIIESYTPKDKWTMHRIACPVDVFVTQGDTSELEDDGKITTHRLGQVTYIIYNELVKREVFVEAYDYGTASIETVVVESQEVTVVERFPTIEVSPTVRAVIDNKISGNKLQTEIFVTGDREDSTLTGISVEMDKRPTVDPPKTRCFLEPNGVQEIINLNFDYLGVEMKLKANSSHKESPILETLYRINEGSWHRYVKPVHIVPGSEAVYGKNTIEYYSRDVFSNIELIRKKEFVIETPKPQFIVKMTVDPETQCGVNLLPSESFLRGYKFVYKIDDQTEQSYTGMFFLKFKNVQFLHIKAFDAFGKESDWVTIPIQFDELAEVLWHPHGFDGTVEDVVSKLVPSVGRLTGCVIGKTPKLLKDSIPKNSRYIELTYGNIMYQITLVPKAEIFLDYHSEVIQKSEKRATIPFRIYDAEGRLAEDARPLVKYSLIPIKNQEQDVYTPSVHKREKEGMFEFGIDVQYLSQEVTKIQVEIKDFPERAKPLLNRDFRIE